MFWLKRIPILVFVLVFGVGCEKSQIPRTVGPAFYHWQTELRLAPAERQLLADLEVKKLYVKFFDVDWNAARQQPVPLAEVQIDTTGLGRLQVVPTVFLTNRIFLQNTDPEALARRVRQKIADIGQQHGLVFSEIQMDCDWTERTRAAYFRFLTALRGDEVLSATIRLHQFKYPDRTGVPPVDRGMLMAYNVGEVREWETENSILDLEILQQYLAPPATAGAYALPLDLALPVFRWGVVFRGGLAAAETGELTYLVNDLGQEHLRDTLRFAQLRPNRYLVRKNTYLQGYYLYAGDRIRLEGVTPEMLEAAAGKLATVPLGGDSLTVAFYHLDTTTLKIFDHEKIPNILAAF